MVEIPVPEVDLVVADLVEDPHRPPINMIGN